jgi:hypothetical protein
MIRGCQCEDMQMELTAWQGSGEPEFFLPGASFSVQAFTR